MNLWYKTKADEAREVYACLLCVHVEPTESLIKRHEADHREKIVREAYENFPEASESLVCLKWKYDVFDFEFIDKEENRRYTVRLHDALRGLELFFNAVDSGKLPGLGLPIDYKTDLGKWDAWAFDALNQMAIFGEVVYG